MPIVPVGRAIVVEIGPCVDNSDFKTLETAIAYDAPGMAVTLIRSGIDGTAGTITTAAITPTSGGANDWTHKAGGVYELELTAVQNSTLGALRVVGVCTGVLPFESPEYTVVPLAIFNALVSGTANLPADALAISTSAPAADALELVALNAKGTDHKLLISTDAQDLNATLHVDAKAISASTAAADSVEANIGNLDAVLSSGFLAGAKEATVIAGFAAGALEATLTAMKGVGWATETLMHINANIEALAGSGVGGANTVTLTVTDALGTPLENVDVLIRNNADTATIRYGLTSSLGVLTTQLDNGSYKVRLNLTGYTFTVPETLTVSGASTDTYIGTAFSASAPAAADQCTVYGWVKDAQGNAKATVTVTAKLEGSYLHYAGVWWVVESETDITDANGLFELSLTRSKYLLQHGDASGSGTGKYRISIPDTSLSSGMLITVPNAATALLDSLIP